MAQGLAQHPGSKVYVDGAGHTRETYYFQAKYDGLWYPNWAWSECTTDCTKCYGGETLEEYAGERWDEDY